MPRELRSLVTGNGVLELSLIEVPMPEPKADQVVVRVDATPINPSDLGLLLGPADISTAERSGTPALPAIRMKVPEALMRSVASRLDQSLPVGNEGAGLVVAAGSAPEAQALLGKTVTMIGGAMYAEYRCLRHSDCMALPEGATAAEGASCFVNPLTALSMVEVMKREGHSALVHTAAASNLGQMLNRICIKDGVKLVNIVRSEGQARILRDIGANYVCDSTAPDFMAKLIEALVETDATLAFDAIGGGPLAGQILIAMEAAANRSAKEYSRYGSSVHKQVYIYGRLDTRPTEIGAGVGLAWSVGGWLLTPFLIKLGPDVLLLRARVMAELKTTFASHYTREISLAEVLQPEIIAAYSRRATGEKYLIVPSKA